MGLKTVEVFALCVAPFLCFVAAVGAVGAAVPLLRSPPHKVRSYCSRSHLSHTQKVFDAQRLP